MQNKLKILYNASQHPVAVLVKGQQFIMEPFAEQTFKQEVADAFLRQHSGKVIPAEQMSKPLEVRYEKPKTLWVANMTGDPDVPKTIRTKVWQNRRYEDAEIDNPQAKPMMLTEQAAGPWKEMTDKDGNLTAARGAWHKVTVPPYQRIEMSEGLANWFVNRQYLSTPKTTDGTQVRKAIIARAPTGFEPDQTWELDELRAYLKYIDPAAPLGDSQKQIETKAAKSKLKDFEVEHNIEKAKREVYKRIFFRMVNHRWPNPLPTRREFQEYMYGLGGGQEEKPAEDPVEFVEKVAEEADESLDALGAVGIDDME